MTVTFIIPTYFVSQDFMSTIPMMFTITGRIPPQNNLSRKTFPGLDNSVNQDHAECSSSRRICPC
jgi:hypothetical protein